jgi:ankyrin repeat protein
MHAVNWYSLRWDSTLVGLLLQHGANIDFKNELPYDAHCDKSTSGKCTFRGQTALTRAAADGYYPVVKLLLEHGANPCLHRQDGATPVQIARENKHEDVAKLIEKYIEKADSRAK